MRDLYIAAAQLTHQLHVVIARHAERLTRLHHGHHKPQNVRDFGTAIDQIADENRFLPRAESPMRQLLRLIS